MERKSSVQEGLENCQEKSIDTLMRVVTSSKRFYKDKYATFATELKRNNVAFSLPDIGKNMLIDHYSLSQLDKPTDDKYSLTDFLEGFNDNTGEGGANNAKPLADQSTMAIAGDQLSSLQNVVAH